MKRMKSLAVIPARYDATRFPGKLMQMLGEKTIICRTYEATIETGLFDDVLVATDSDIIRKEVESFNGKVVMTKSTHESGTDRIAEAVAGVEAEVVINVQGDTPFINKEALQRLLDLFSDPEVEVASLMDVISDESSLNDPNVVKVCVDLKMNSLFFSRSVIPFPRSVSSGYRHFRHIGVYGFRKSGLMRFTQLPVSILEETEKIECLRFLENGIPLRMAIADPIGVDINTPADLEKARTQLGNRYG